MTLIASMIDFPLMLSDLAVSADMLEQPSEVQLPMFAEGVQFKGRGYQIVGLSQKSIILAPDLALSWSGTLEQARDVARHLFADAPFLDGDAVIESIESALAGQTVAVSIFVATTSFCISFGRRVHCDHYGYRMALAGSGMKHFQDVSNTRTESIRAEMGAQERYMRLAQSLAAAAANAMVIEAQTMGTLEERYGGGFELVVREDIFGKIELHKKPMTLVFCRSGLRDGKIVLGISTIIQQFYFGEDLYYLATHLHSNVPPAGLKARRQGLYIPYDDSPGLAHKLIKVEPIIRLAAAAPKPTSNDIASDRIYTHVVFENEYRATGSSNLICITNAPETPMYFEIKQMQNGMDLRYSSLFYEDLRASIKGAEF